jgi:hypothetical protein
MSTREEQRPAETWDDLMRWHTVAEWDGEFFELFTPAALDGLDPRPLAEFRFRVLDEEWSDDDVRPRRIIHKIEVMA